jgi:hypothetical protein
VLPIDEWSVGAGCGSETPGVDDDAQMNGVVKASLLLAAAAARALGAETPRSALWEAVGANVVLLFNETRGHHDQFTSPTCPDGWGGTHYTPAPFPMPPETASAFDSADLPRDGHSSLYLRSCSYLLFVLWFGSGEGGRRSILASRLDTSSSLFL